MATYNIVRTDGFKGDLKRLYKQYKKSKEDIEKEINRLVKNPLVGIVHPGLPIEIRKIRLPLKKYKIGKSGALRMYFIVHPNGNIYMLLLYKKGSLTETDVINELKNRLKEMIKQLGG